MHRFCIRTFGIFCLLTLVGGAEIDAGEMTDVIAVPRRAVRDNRRVWVVDRQDLLQVRDAAVRWQSGQQLLLSSDTLLPGDHIVVSRTAGLVPGAKVRSRQVDPGSGRALSSDADIAAHD